LPLPPTCRSASIRSALHGLHLLDLPHWGLENGAEGEWPQRDRSAVELQVGYLAAPADVLQLLLSNPNGPSPKEQEQTLLLELRTAKNAKQAAVALLNAIYRADNPALQSAASDLVRESLGSESPDTAPYMEWLAIVSAGE
jgi:hypothetical protein